MFDSIAYNYDKMDKGVNIWVDPRDSYCIQPCIIIGFIIYI